MPAFKDLTGQRYGRLTVVSRASDHITSGGDRKSRWNCICDCGNHTTVLSAYLRNGDTRSCGCLEIESKKATPTTHGKSKTKLYQTWQGIKARCYDKNHKNYSDYGGRGVVMCDSWRDSYEEFEKWIISNGYEQGLTVERIDVNGIYSPDNCTLVDRVAQANNRRNTITITYNDETHSLAWWAERTGIKYTTLYHRIKTGMPLEKALKK